MEWGSVLYGSVALGQENSKGSEIFSAGSEAGE
jgi:hypothetical protein